MRIHSHAIVTIVVTLLFVSGTVGCRSNGGAWYNPKSYTWTNPFTKSNDAPAYSSDTQDNSKPSLDSRPNIGVPEGGYTDNSNSYASRSGVQSTSSANSSLEQGVSPSLPTTQGAPSHGSGYSVAETSPYPPPYASGQTSAAGTSVANPYQYPPATAQANTTPSQYPTSAPQGTSPYGSNDYSASAQQQYQPMSAVNYPPATPDYSSGDQIGGTAPVANPPAASNNYSPFGTGATPQTDPYAAPVQQSSPATSSPTGGYYESVTNPQSANPQPTQASPAGGYYDQPATPLQPYPSAQPSQPTSGFGY